MPIISKFPHYVSIVVPSTVNTSEIASVDMVASFVQSTSVSMGNMFGGTTNIRAYGTWIDHSGEVVLENVVVVGSWVSEDIFSTTLDFMVGLAENVCSGMAQECVLIEVDHQAYLVSA